MEKKFDEYWYSKDNSKLMNILKIDSDLSYLFQYMREKNKANVRVYHYNEGIESDTIFIVPSADINNHHSSSLRKQLNNIPVIFVESNGIDFNYAHSCNIGIEKALELGYKWVVICNDDVVFHKEPSSLIEILSESEPNAVFTPTNGANETDRYHGEEFTIFKSNFALKGLSLYNSKWSFAGNRTSWEYVSLYLKNFPQISRHLRYNLAVNNTANTFAKLARAVTPKMVNFADFGIFPSSLLKGLHFDETFWNGTEDYELSMRIYKEGLDVKKINFPIESVGSASLGQSVRKKIIGLFNSLYLSKLISQCDS